ncbi:DUF3072 domain-containing protein [Pelagibacterium xiamenense]|uniref:DUF3072 domain-containing protein n=1 Tax=Pelagibacterium xiamenense TaxID=2901140 RepID=UPI001E2D96BE|nr:DUF3072 domain-containing protein [Pelagibacterium xiamenense]MCD7060106.1 DUF3072 domain-containing protein [Pelagibacterium xiamenense]
MSDIHPGIATANPDANRINAHEDYLTGGGVMTSEQRRELIYLAQKAEEPDAYRDDLTALEAENRIKLLRRKLDG